jgi:hypothetical protein
MARCAVAGRSTVVGTTLRAVASLYATTAVRPRIIEIGLFNTTATAVAVAVVRFTNATGVGTGLTEVCLDDPTHTIIATGFAGHTADGAVGSPVRQATLGAAVGAGVIWTFGDSGFHIPSTTADGVGIICPTGTGQILDYYIEWLE